jgi:hypothetical protein
MCRWEPLPAYATLRYKIDYVEVCKVGRRACQQVLQPYILSVVLILASDENPQTAAAVHCRQVLCLLHCFQDWVCVCERCYL